MPRPVIGFLTDFGADSAAAICRAVILSIANDAHVVDITHGVRMYAIRDGAYLLRAALEWFPIGVHLAVVDPGVGTERLPIAVRTQRGDILVGPDNGLLMPACERLGGLVEARALENRELMLPATSSTFHGRDVFAPIAAHLAAGTPFEAVGSVVPIDRLVALHFPEPRVGAGVLETEAIYVDSFGNVRLSARPADLARAVGPAADTDAATAADDAHAAGVRPGTVLRVELPRDSRIVEPVPWARTFGEIPEGSPLLYGDSSGDVAFGVNRGDAAARYGVASGDRVVIRVR